MDLLERARALSGCPLFEGLAPAAVIRLAERARGVSLAPGERRTTDATVWVVATGALAVVVHDAASSMTASIIRRQGARARAGNVLGMIRVVRDATPGVALVAEQPSTLVGLAIDDVRDMLEEDPVALTTLAERLAALLLEDAP